MSASLSVPDGSAELYQPSPIKRHRRTRAGMDDIRTALLGIVNAGDGMTVRHLFYRLVGTGVIAKTEAAYDNVVVRLALEMRRSGDIPYGKIIDGSRLYTCPQTYDSVRDAIDDCAAHYRRSYWRNADRVVECWCEKDAIRALIQPVTWSLAVPLMVTRGFSSESVVQSLAEDTKRDGRQRVILALNDHDPSGSLMAPDIIRRAQHYAPDADFYLEQVALTEEQVAEYNLPTRPTKKEGNRHAAKFGSKYSVELDSIDPHELREMLREAIEGHMDYDELKTLCIAERAERKSLIDLARWGAE